MGRSVDTLFDGQTALDGGVSSMSGTEMMKKAMLWRHNNLHAWCEMKKKANELAEARKKFSIDQLAVLVRYEVHDVEGDSGFKVNNTLRAPLARLLVKEEPHLEPYIEMRASKADWA